MAKLIRNEGGEGNSAENIESTTDQSWYILRYRRWIYRKRQEHLKVSLKIETLKVSKYSDV